MKRLAFIVLWTVIFFLIMVGAWMGCWHLLRLAGIAPALAQDLVDGIDLVTYVAFFAMPLLGLLLGLFGKLPGTRSARIAVNSGVQRKL